MDSFLHGPWYSHSQRIAKCGKVPFSFDNAEATENTASNAIPVILRVAMSASESFDPNSATETGRASWVRWRIVALLMALSFVSWFNRVNLQAAYAEHIKNEIGITPTEIGNVSTVFLLVYALFMTPGGWFTDRFGPRLSLSLMGIGLGIGAVFTGVAGQLLTTAGPLLIAFFLIRTPMGILATPMYPAGSRSVASWFPVMQRASANGFVQGGAAVGIALTPTLFGYLMDKFDWPRAFIITGAVNLFAGLVWLWYARNSPAQHSGVNQIELDRIGTDLPLPGKPKSTSVSWLALLRNRSLVVLTVSYAAVGYIEYLFNFWTQYYFKEVRGVDVETSRNYVLIINLSFAAGMIVGGGVSDVFVRRFGIRLGRAIVPVGGMLAGAGCVLIGIQQPAAGQVLIWFCLALAAIGATEAPQWTIAIELGGRHAATAAGIFNTGGNLGGALAPSVTAAIGTRLGWDWALTIGSIVCLVGACLWFFINPRERVPES
jgi:sugar phosphate permease